MVDRVATVDSVTRLFPKATLDALRLALGGAGVGTYTQDVPAGAAGKVTITHNLGTRFVGVVVFDVSVEPWLEVKVDVTVPAGGKTVVLGFGAARAAGQYKVAVIPMGASSTPTTPTPNPGVAPSIKTEVFDAMVQGAEFEQQLIIDGTPEITVTTVSGGIPGVTVSSTGKAAGIPTTVGSHQVRLRAINGVGSVEKTLTAVVTAPPVSSSWSPYTSDLFAGATAADVNGRTADRGDGGVAKQWMGTGGAFGIADGALVATGTATGGAFVPLASTACEVSATVKAMPNTSAESHLFAMVISRSAAAAAGVSEYRVRMYSTGNLAITRVENGTETYDPIAVSEQSSYKVGDVVTLRRVDSPDHTVAYLSVRVGSSEVASYVDRAPLPAGSFIGFYREGRTGSFDAVTVRTQSTTISAPTIETSSLSFVQGSPTSQKIVVNGDPTITVTSISGEPAGVDLLSSGDVEGIPTGSGSGSWVVRATNAGGSVDKTIAYTIAAQGGSSGGGEVFGAEGLYWASFTPRPGDVYERTIEVDCTYTAIAAGINTLLAETGSAAKTQIKVRPGRLPVGFGAGSASKGVLQDIGSANRTWNIVVTPRDGLGTVSATLGNDVAFVNVSGVTFLGIDFTDVALIQRNCNRFNVSHTFATNGNMTSNGGGGQKDSEYVECVFGPEDQVTNGTDRCAIRTNNGVAAVNNGYIGVYMGSMQRRSGTTGHCDTLQLSSQGNTPNIKTRIIGSVLWPSANQTFIPTETPHAQQVYVEKSLFIAGPVAIAARYPQTPRDEGGAEPTQLYQTEGESAFVGGATDITMKDSIVIGTIADGHTWKSVSNVRVSEAQANPQGTGAFTVDPSLNSKTITKQQLDQMSPLPSKARQYALWNRQFQMAVV